MVKAWTEFCAPLHLREVRKSGTIILLPTLSGTHYANLFAAAYLAATDKEPLNTRRAKYQAVAHFRLACIVGDIKRPEYRLSYETGLSEPELRAINILIEHPVHTLRSMVDQKEAGVSFANLEAMLSKSEPLADATQTVRKTYVADYLKWLIRVGDGVLSWPAPIGWTGFSLSA